MLLFVHTEPSEKLDTNLVAKAVWRAERVGYSKYRVMYNLP